MSLFKLQSLVSYATNGEMQMEEVNSIVEKLQAEKAAIMKNLSAMPEDEQRKSLFKELHTILYRLYDAKVMILNGKSLSTSFLPVELHSEKYVVFDGKNYVVKGNKMQEYSLLPMSSIANMVICYDCH